MADTRRLSHIAGNVYLAQFCTKELDFYEHALVDIATGDRIVVANYIDRETVVIEETEAFANRLLDVCQDIRDRR